MGTSGNPAKKAAADEAKAQASSLAEFKARRKGKVLQLPSGLSMRVRKVELQSFIIQGEVPNPLMQVVSEALEKGKKSNIPDMMGVEDGQINMDMVRDMYAMVNRVVCEVSVEPKVHPAPENEVDRDDDILYVDELEETDKMFLFQWITGGTEDVATFLEEANSDMATLAESQGSKSPAKRAPRTTKK